MDNPFAAKDFVTLKGIKRTDLELIFETALEMEKIVEKRTRADLLHDKVLGVAFFQVSTRTRMSFESAMLRLGGGIVGFADPKTTRSGDYYSESLQDVMHMMNGYADAIVIRHPQSGAPAEAATVAEVPVINAGDGYNEHPTQAVQDVYTMLKVKGSIDGLKVALVGDQNMRVMHSLPLALAQYNTHVYFVSPKDQAMPQPWLAEFTKVGLSFEQRIDLEGILSDLDVIYLMGTKTPSYSEGRTEVMLERPQTPQPYIINREKINRAKKSIIVMHPLPRVDELPVDVDSMDAAFYFKQANNGVAVRMAILSLIFGR
ncbi:MAG: aspartate carbamoyltransferase [Anaerolinea sp.]|nr:aspartate carbamoyltransferase [Anaerolinea sp.]